MIRLQITILTMLIGALLLGLVFRRSQRSLLVGSGLGAVAGLLGPQIFMLPLNYCAFKPDHAYSFGLHILGQTITVNAAALIGLLLVGIGTWAVLLLVDRLQWRYHCTGRILPPPESSPRFFKGWRWLPWLLLAPTLLFSLFTTYLPALQTFSLATRLSRLGVEHTIPVCLDNFASLIAGPRGNAEYYVLSDGYLLHVKNVRYLLVLGVSAFYTVSIVLLANSLSLGVAYIAHRRFKGANLYRALLIWPSALSAVVTGTIFVFIFSQRVGLSSIVLTRLGLPEIAWLQTPQLAPWVITLAGTWNTLGLNILLYIAGLQNIPSDLLEAAAVDGANAWQKFRHVTIPLLTPIIFFVAFSNLTYTFFDLFRLIDKLTQGGPMNATSNLIYEIYTLGITNRDLGKAAAQSLVMMTIVVGLTLIQFRVLGRRVNYGIN